MSSQRDLLVNFDRMRREMDQLLDDAWGSRPPGSGRRQQGFVPRVDVYYCESSGDDPRPIAIVEADLAGVDPDAVNLEISGRELVLSGRRPVRETEGRVYQQVEIATGSFRRKIELGVEVLADQATATFEDGILRVELPVRVEGEAPRRVPIERAS